MRIRLSGPWPLVWVAWALIWLAWMLWSPFASDVRVQRLGLAMILTAWALLEIAGGLQNARKVKEPELARTLSQILQRLVQEGHVYRGWWRGYPGLVTALSLLLAWSAYLAFSPFDRVAGILLGLGVWAYLQYHLLRRGIYG